MAPKKSSGEADVAPSSSFSSEAFASYFLLALFPLLCITFVYNRVYSMTLEDYGLLYLPVLAVSASCLALAYQHIIQGSTARLMAQVRQNPVNHKRLGLSKEAADAQQQANTQTEATAWAFFLANAMFGLLYLFIAFSVLKSIEVHYNYIAANVLSSVITWQFGVAYSK